MPVQEGRIRTILVPTDFSEGAARALRWARTLARAFNYNLDRMVTIGATR
jgi:nucleotide-binding universal stress UspA family protein